MAQNYQCSNCGKHLSCYYSVWRHKKKSCKVKNQQRSNEALAPKTYDIHKDAASYPSYEMKKHVKKSSSTQSLKNFKRSKCVKSYGSSQSLQNHQLAETENQDFVEELDGSLGRLSDEEISLVLESRYKEKQVAERKRQIQMLNRILDEE